MGESFVFYGLPASVTCIGRNAFQGCRLLTAAVIPEGVADIGSAAFYDCAAMTELTLGSGLIAIGDEAFFGCAGLSYIMIPAGVSQIGVYAFADCAGLTGIGVDPDNESFSADSAGCLFNKAKTELLLAPMGLSGVYSISDGVADIAFETFFGCEKLVGLVIPNSLTTVGDYAFYDCSALRHVTYCGTAQQWGYIAIGDENTALVQAETQHFGAAPVSGQRITMRIENFDAELYGETSLYGALILQLKNGTVIRSAQCTMTLRQLMEQVNTNYTAYSSTQLAALAELIQKFAVMQSWKVENLYNS